MSFIALDNRLLNRTTVLPGTTVAPLGSLLVVSLNRSMLIVNRFGALVDFVVKVRILDQPELDSGRNTWQKTQTPTYFH
jgi:hypothetical protein